MAKIGPRTRMGGALQGAGAGASLGSLLPGVGTIAGAVIGGGLGLAQNIWSARRADSAHQREVRDLRRAGLNPYLSARGSGADVGPMQDVGRSVSSALEVQRQRAEIDLLRAQAGATDAQRIQALTNAWEVRSFAGARGAQAAAAADASDAAAVLSRQNATQLRETLKLVKQEIAARTDQFSSSAAAAAARAALDRAAERGALNREDIQELLSQYPVVFRALMQVLLSRGEPR